MAEAQVDRASAQNQFINSEALSAYKVTDLQSFRVTADHVSSISNIHHYYFQQEYNGIAIYGAVGSAHFDASQKMIRAQADLEGKLESRISTGNPSISAEEAIRSAALEFKYEFEGELELLSSANNVEQQQIFRNPTLSVRDIPVRLMYQPVSSGDIRLAWDLSIFEIGQQNYWSLRVDAETGEVLHRENWTISCNYDHDHGTEGHVCSETKSNNHTEAMPSAVVANGYRVYAMPLQDPADGNRTLEIDPEELTASPYGWHDDNGVAGHEYTITRGNNAHAYDDGDNPNFSPDGTDSLLFDFAIDTTYSAGTQSEPAAITNLFYWNNVIHDVWYQYGFTEAAGNFQENNYGNGGAGSDYVNAEAQDGSGTCNANMSTGPDGGNPTMQMYVCNSRDGDLDNLVVVHEYGHGISIRLTGGPGTSSCLNNSEQMGEGWSDYFGLMMTLQAGDLGTDAVGVGTWLIGESINGPGIRTHPYSTDLGVNPHTYANINGIAIPHGVGSVWCVMLWEMTWALIDQYGFDADFYFGTGGNNIAMALVMEGLKLQPCSPGFVDGRDAILLADENLYGGANKCLIWDAFAKRGLGFSADQGSSGSASDGTEAFDTPGSLTLEKTVDLAMAGPGDTLTYTLKLSNPDFCDLTLSNIALFDTIPANTFYVSGSASDGGSEADGVVTYPVIDTMYPGDSLTRTFQVYIDTAYTLAADFEDDMESGSGNWTTSTTNATYNWAINGTNPNSGTNAWFAEDIGTTVDQFLELNNTVTPTSSTLLSFSHDYDTETGWDGGVVQYSLDGGTNWLDLGPYMTQNGYNSTIDNNGATPAFAGTSGGYIETVVDLSSFDGQNMNIRFWMSCDASVAGVGWYIDDVTIKSNFIDNTAFVTADGGISLEDRLDTPTEIFYAQCINGIQDGDETGVDCGGAFCPPCPTCDDGIQNGDETGVDCGGLVCDACPTCDDGILNGNEVEIDCGGPDCPECPCLDNDLTLSITLDNYPSETSWEIQDSTGATIYSGGTYPGEPSGSTLTFDFCVPDGCYEFFIYDSFGDGICCAWGIGSYSLINNGDSSILASGGDFDNVDSTDFCLNAIDPPSGCDSLLAISGIIVSDTFHAEYVLNSDGEIQSPSVVVFRAGSEITLDTNFTVDLGAEFSAEIEDCINALNRSQQNKRETEKKNNSAKGILKE